MRKTINRLSKESIIAVHDNLLANLYELDLNNISSKNIDGEEYLVNEISGRYYQISLVAKIPISFLIVNNKKKKYNELSKEQQEIIYEQLKEKLYFTNIEILFTNILFDRYLNSDYDYDISLTDIERYYRKKGNSKKVRIHDLNYNRYLSTLVKLTEKEIVLITKPKFRNEGKRNYGVNNLNIKQKFLNVTKAHIVGENDLLFTFDFSKFGKVIKLCRRYSNILVPKFYQYNLNKCMKHTIAYFIGLELFIKKNPNKRYNNMFMLDVNRILQKVHFETRNDEYKGYSLYDELTGTKNVPNKLRTYKRVMKYIKDILDQFAANVIIYKYEIKYSYDETENFIKKHEYHYDNESNLLYSFTLNDLSDDVDAKFIIYLDKPSKIIMW